MTFDANEYHANKNQPPMTGLSFSEFVDALGMPEMKEPTNLDIAVVRSSELNDLLYIARNVTYWFPEIQSKLSDAEAAILREVFLKAVEVTKAFEDGNRS